MTNASLVRILPVYKHCLAHPVMNLVKIDRRGADEDEVCCGQMFYDGMVWEGGQGTRASGPQLPPPPLPAGVMWPPYNNLLLSPIGLIFVIPRGYRAFNYVVTIKLNIQYSYKEIQIGKLLFNNCITLILPTNLKNNSVYTVTIIF